MWLATKFTNNVVPLSYRAQRKVEKERYMLIVHGKEREVKKEGGLDTGRSGKKKIEGRGETEKTIYDAQ
jgi:hypothetical protein